MARHLRTTAELEMALVEQRLALRSSAAAYDQGHLWEAKRLATVAYTLLHDGTGRSKALLTQLGVKSRLRFVSTARQVDHGSPSVALTLIEMSDEGTTYVPYSKVDLVPEWSVWLQFSRWYDQTIFKYKQSIVFSRKNLIFALRAQDGGAHFDQELRDDAYHPFSTVNDEQIKTGLPGAQKPVPNAHLASMRQIAWELERTLSSYDEMRS